MYGDKINILKHSIQVMLWTCHMINKAKVSVHFIFLYWFGQCLWVELIIKHIFHAKKSHKKSSNVRKYVLRTLLFAKCYKRDIF